MIEQLRSGYPTPLTFVVHMLFVLSSICSPDEKNGFLVVLMVPPPPFLALLPLKKLCVFPRSGCKLKKKIIYGTSVNAPSPSIYGSFFLSANAKIFTLIKSQVF